MQSNPNQEISWKMTYLCDRKNHWNNVAKRMDTWSGWGGYYQRRLSQIYQFLIPPGQRVIEIGCGIGDLLASLKPSLGVGVDFSDEMIKRAQKQHPQLKFINQNAQELSINEKFDFIIMADLVNDLWDVQGVFENLIPLTKPSTRIILNSYSRLWQMPLGFAQKFSLAKPNLPQNWLTMEDSSNLLYISGFEVIRSWQEVIFPFYIPLIERFFNHFLVKIWPTRGLALTNFILARHQIHCADTASQPVVSVVVPARNEEGNIPQIFDRVPDMGKHTELVFVEGNSSDNTYSVIEKQIALHPERECKLFKQSGKGKGDAVRVGYEKASGDILMILDADLTVLPEDLPRFYDALISYKGDFINGVRLVYPMQKEAMRFFNLIGNKLFSLAFSWLLGQPIKDTLCGTNVLCKKDYLKIANNRSYFGDFDPFGDFDLLFGAARLGLKIVDMPIRYHERTYGTTNINRWKHGWLLMRMVLFAASRIKFV